VKTAGKQLVRISIRADERVIVPVRDFVWHILRESGVDEAMAAGLNLLIEEACLLVVTNAFDPGEDGEFDLSVQRRPNQIVVVLEDRGLPGLGEERVRDWVGRAGLSLLRAHADEISFVNLGKRGQCIELVKQLPPGAAPPMDAEAATAAADLPSETDAVSLRLMQPDDAVALARCMYRCYGYTYANEAVYFPGRIAELMASRLLASCVAVNARNEVVGHLGLQFATSDARTAESGIAVVDPRYRGRKLFEKMKRFMADWAADHGLLGLFSMAVAVHPVSQKGNVALGATETGVLLGYLPPGTQFRSMKDVSAARRESAVMYYLKVNDGPVRDIFAPPHHAAIIRTIHEGVLVSRNYLAAPSGLTLGAVRDVASTISLTMKPEQGRAILRVSDFGADALEVVHNRLRDVCKRGLASIQLLLPLGSPHTALLCRAYEAMGFSFAGMDIELGEGDYLKLHYRHNAEIDPTAVVTVSPLGRRLAEYAVAADQIGASARHGR
jgi:serine/threonine-protein kinase RsbW